MTTAQVAPLVRDEVRAPDHFPDRPALPRVVFALTAMGVFGLVVAKSWLSLTTATDEGGDTAANSLLLLQAKRFELLVGNYSRLGFNHPGPAHLYVRAFGEWFFHDLLGIVPSAWNGQVFAALLLNGLLIGTALTLVVRWTRSWISAGVAGIAMVGYFAVDGTVISSTWMPFAYFAPFVLLLVAASSVAAGRVGDLWALGLASGFLVHGHAEFLFFVPLVVVAALLVLVLRASHRQALFAAHRRTWLLFAGIVGLFLLPIVLDLVLHWPGEFGKYLTYGKSDLVGDRTAGQVARYVSHYWPGGERSIVGLVSFVCLVVGALVLAWRVRDPRVRRFLVTGVAASGYVTALFVIYAAIGIDNLTEWYVGEFSRAVPFGLMVVVAAGLGLVLDEWRAARSLPAAALRLPTIVAVVGAVLVAHDAPSLSTYREQVDGVPQAVAVIAGYAEGRPAVVEIEDQSWPQGIAVVLGGHRRAVRVCMANARWRVLVSDPFVCSPDELRAGVPMTIRQAKPQPADRVVLATLSNDVILTAQAR